jgi:hypothetical protein
MPTRMGLPAASRAFRALSTLIAGIGPVHQHLVAVGEALGDVEGTVVVGGELHRHVPQPRR